MTRIETSKDGTIKIEVADSAGYCWGVERAIDLSVEAASDPTRPVFTHGDLIHNNYTVNKLRDEHDINSVKEVDEAPEGSALVIRAHGVPPQTKLAAANAGLTVVDGTCPLVTNIHKKALQLLESKHQIFVIGKASHPEVIGIVGAVEDAGGNAQVLESIADAEALPVMKRVGVVMQSTLVARKAGDIVSVLTAKSREVMAINTICHVTTERQQEADHLSKNCDLILVVGSPHSSNTKKLAEVCATGGAPTHQVEGVPDLDLSWFNGKKHIGIHAGASSPVEVIEEIIAFLLDNLVESAA
ncbi:MAG: 4-hydroxy-3-methylbut-2-enyl diphosphate reductase [Planctomycetota bacterium]|jgi:4-hydroxy-3-methylbut-2-enyl diphosphate reductase